MSKNDENWLSNYEALKQWTLDHGHFPNRAKIEGRGLLNWYKYNAKLIKQGKLSPEREQMILELEEMRSGGHTGGAQGFATMTIRLRLRCADATMTMRYRYDDDDHFCCPNVLISAHFKQ